MVIVELEKDITIDKFMVISWYVVRREDVNSINLISNQVEAVELTDIPKYFYTNSNEYFLEEGKLRRYVR